MDEQQGLNRADLQHWLGVLRRRWLVIVACVLVVGGSAALFAETQQKKYTASASVLFNQSQLGYSLLGLPNSTNTNVTAPQADNVKLLGSTVVASATSRVLGGHPGPATIATKIAVSEDGTSDVVSIAATDPDPEFAARLANVYASQAIKFQTATSRNAVIDVRDSLEAQLAGMTAVQRTSPAAASLQARISQLNTLAAAQTGEAQLIQPATVPTSPSSPKTKLDLVLGICLGLLFGIGLALLLERLNKRIERVEQLSEIFDCPILAEIPETDAFESANPDRGEREVQAGPYGTAYGDHSIDMLQARLRYFKVDGRLRSVLVTSCAPQEGKSTIALHLARASAISTRGRVLLLEADLRRPAIARASGLHAGPGLSDVLAGDYDYQHVVQTVPLAPSSNGSGEASGLDVIVAGPVPPNPGQLIESDRLRALLLELSTDYDLVIVDSGPALVVPDPLALMAQVDGVLVVCRMGSITRDLAIHLRDEFVAAHAPVVGVVANRVKRSLESSYHYEGYVSPEDAVNTGPAANIWPPTQNRPATQNGTATHNPPATQNGTATHNPPATQNGTATQNPPATQNGTAAGTEPTVETVMPQTSNGAARRRVRVVRRSRAS